MQHANHGLLNDLPAVDHLGAPVDQIAPLNRDHVRPNLIVDLFPCAVDLGISWRHIDQDSGATIPKHQLIKRVQKLGVTAAKQIDVIQNILKRGGKLFQLVLTKHTSKGPDAVPKNACVSATP